MHQPTFVGMIELILTYSTGTETISIPQSWDEVSLSKYCELVNKDRMKGDTVDLLNRASIITGISIENLNQCNADTITLLLNNLAFISDHEPVQEAAKKRPNITGFDYDTFDFSSTEWGYFEEAKQLIKHCNDNNINKVNIGSQLVEIYTRKRVDGKEVPGLDVSERPVTEVIGLVNFFLSRSERF